MNYSKRLNEVIPGGAHTYSRGDDQYPENAPALFVRGEGCYTWDPSGNKFLDYGMALRAVTVGYGFKEIADAAIEEIWKGNNLQRASLTELIAAETIVDLIPSADMVKFAKNGSTVTTAAVKLARAYTGRNYIARCLEHPFFSYDDWFIGDTALQKGIPEDISKLTIHFNYNNIDSLQQLFDQYPNQIACVIMEPASFDPPIDNFLQKVKELCKKYNSVFIFDEMITGFRWHLQGAQTYYNVEPDLTTFGKGMANGFSVAALVGKREIMELGGIKKEGSERVFLTSTTHGAEMCGLGAFIKTVEVYKKYNVVEHLWDYGRRFTDGINKIAKEYGIEEYFGIYGYPCSPNYFTKDKNGNLSLGYRTLYAQEMIKEKIVIPGIVITYSHKEPELEMTFEAHRKVLKTYCNALEDGLDKYLNSKIIKPVFRKFN